MKNKGTATVLALFLGGLGIHQFYLYNGSKGTMYLLFCWTGIPFILAIIDFIMLITMSEQSFDMKYNFHHPVAPQTHNVTFNVPNHHIGSISDELVKLCNLLDKGIITQAEFDQQKAKLLA